MKYEKWITLSVLSNILLPFLQVCGTDVVVVVVAAVVVVGGVDGCGVGQVKFKSLSTPGEIIETKPGWLLPVMLLIQSWYLETWV